MTEFAPQACARGVSAPSASRAREPSTSNKHPKGRGCWYFVYLSSCVLCGRFTEDRERRWTPRPEHWSDRHEHREEACGDHFC